MQKIQNKHNNYLFINLNKNQNFIKTLPFNSFSNEWLALLEKKKAYKKKKKAFTKKKIFYYQLYWKLLKLQIKERLDYKKKLNLKWVKSGALYNQNFYKFFNKQNKIYKINSPYIYAKKEYTYINYGVVFIKEFTTYGEEVQSLGFIDPNLNYYINNFKNISSKQISKG